MSHQEIGSEIHEKETTKVSPERNSLPKLIDHALQRRLNARKNQHFSGKLKDVVKDNHLGGRAKKMRRRRLRKDGVSDTIKNLLKQARLNVKQPNGETGQGHESRHIHDSIAGQSELGRIGFSVREKVPHPVHNGDPKAERESKQNSESNRAAIQLALLSKLSSLQR